MTASSGLPLLFKCMVTLILQINKFEENTLKKLKILQLLLNILEFTYKNNFDKSYFGVTLHASFSNNRPFRPKSKVLMVFFLQLVGSLIF